MDIDIDFFNKDKALDTFKHINASISKNGKLIKHNSGIYIQEIPHNIINNMSNIHYKEAENRGYFKIDFLNVNVYNGVENIKHLEQLLEHEPEWNLLLDEKFVNQLFHLKTHIDILKITQPTSVEQLAAVLAMIRPAKKYLIGKDWNTIMNEIWTKSSNNDTYAFKKAHAISLATAIIIQMNLLLTT